LADKISFQCPEKLREDFKKAIKGEFSVRSRANVSTALRFLMRQYIRQHKEEA